MDQLTNGETSLASLRQFTNSGSLFYVQHLFGPCTVNYFMSKEIYIIEKEKQAK